MRYEANFFIGKHDLQAFRSIDCQSNTSIKTIDEIKISKNNENLNISWTAVWLFVQLFPRSPNRNILILNISNGTYPFQGPSMY